MLYLHEYFGPHIMFTQFRSPVDYEKCKRISNFLKI